MAATTKNSVPDYNDQLRKFGATAMVTLFAFMILSAFLTPFAYMVLTSLKTKDQIIESATGSIFPVSTVTYDGEWNGTLKEGGYPIYEVPVAYLEAGEAVDLPADAEKIQLALVQTGRRSNPNIFYNPDTGEEYEWIGNHRDPAIAGVQTLDFQWNNFGDAWRLADFPLLFRNTLVIAIAGVIGTLISCIAVGYAFARFPLPGKNILFLIVIATIFLPRQVMLVPLYDMFNRIGWTGTWLPLIVPHFFANGYNVFLFRQYFLTLPRELDEAAMIDGAGPFGILMRVIIPQSWPVIIAVTLFHLVFAWNDYFEPLIYTLGSPELQPIAVGIQVFNYRYAQQPQLIQATALLALALPVFLFFVAQRFFMRGVVITGVDK